MRADLSHSRLPKFFSIFAVKLVVKKRFSVPGAEDQTHWVDLAHLSNIQANDARIYNVEQFDTYQVTVDFRSAMKKAKALRTMAELTFAVREECPVAKKLGVKGGMVNGEGIVWKSIHVEAPLKLEKFNGPKCWVKTGAKSALSTSDEVRTFVETVTGW